MNIRQKTYGIFAGVQAIGLFCMFTWQWAPAAAFLWGAALVLLFPGNFLSAMLAEKLFWNSGLSQGAILAMEVPILLVCNAIVWLGAISTGRRLIRRRRPELGTAPRA
jgi:hypothetical protein